MRLHAQTFNCKAFSDRPYNKMINAYEAAFKEASDNLNQKLQDLLLGQEVHQAVNKILDMYHKSKVIISSDKFAELTTE